MEHRDPLTESLKWFRDRIQSDDIVSAAVPYRDLGMGLEEATTFTRQVLRDFLEKQVVFGSLEEERSKELQRFIGQALKTYVSRTSKIVYKMPSTYYPYEEFLERCQVESIINSVARMKILPLEGLAAAEQLHYVFLQWVYDHQPMLAFTRELLTSLITTTPPEDVMYGEVCWPYPVWAVALPKGLLKTEEGHAVTYIIVQTTTPETYKRYEQEDLLSENPMGVGDSALINGLEDNVFSVNLITEGPCYYHNNGLKDEDLLKSVMIPEDLVEGDFSESDAKLVERATSLVCNIALFLMACPEEFEESQHLRTKRGKKIPGKKKKREQATEIWSPNIIGRSYARAYREAKKGSHASPHMHWRRPHWHRYRVGKGRKQIRLKWLDRIFVNPESD